MSKKTKGDTPGAKPLLILAVIAALLFGGLIYYVKYGPTSKTKPDNPDVISLEKPPANEVTVTVPVAQGGGPGGKFTTRTMKVPAGSDKIVASVNAFLEGTKIVQPEARLIDVKYAQGNAALNFSSNFNQTYGTDDEVTLVQGIMRAVKANSDAKTVTFLAANKPISTLGSIELDGPQSLKEWLAARAN
ncbi:MAG: GerMN domain-containing protein [Armatimonadetes bacterium]|nr:GerMN domain-containing protein [Armatimonadota bacterium]